jgi:phospholipase/carboxylesterase
VSAGTLTLSRAVAKPHGGGRILTAGAPLDSARAAMILVHGRGATAEDILELRNEWRAPGVAFLAPQAADFTWYPHTFLAPLPQNEPHLSSALALLAALVEEVGGRGIPPERVILLGFSQGGCLALEFCGRNARRWGGVVGLSGGLIGPPGREWKFEESLDSAPVFIGCSDRDPHIPATRVQESAAELKRIGGEVESRLYPGLGHTVNRDELAFVQGLVDRVVKN